jgi:hypothetical protein
VITNKRLSDEQAAALEAGHEVYTHEITTRLPGGQGEPLIILRDHGAWEQQLADERRRQLDEQIAGTVAAIRDGEAEREWAPRPDLSELATAARASIALATEARQAPGRVAAQLDATQALVEGWAATEPPPPDPEQARRDRDNDYSFGLAETMARLRG